MDGGRAASRSDHPLPDAAFIAAHRPDALVTDQPQVRAPEDRIFFTISTFDVTRPGPRRWRRTGRSCPAIRLGPRAVSALASPSAGPWQPTKTSSL